MAAAAILDFYCCNISGLSKCVQHRIGDIPTKFDENWSQSKAKETVSVKRRWWQPPSCFLTPSYSFDTSYSFNVEFATFPINLARFGRIVMKRSHYSEIQDGGSHHFECVSLGFLDMRIEFCIEFVRFPSSLVRFGPLVKKWQQLIEI